MLLLDEKMKIINDEVQCGFRATYSYRIEYLKDHKKYCSSLFGRLSVAIQVLFSNKLIISLNDMVSAAANHDNCYFAIELRKIVPVNKPKLILGLDKVSASQSAPNKLAEVSASKATLGFEETDPDILSDLKLIMTTEKKIRGLIKELNLSSEHIKKYELLSESTMSDDAQIRKKYWYDRKESALSELSLLCSDHILKHENSKIADSKNENRAGKIAERYSELYTNEWTNLVESFSDDGTNVGKLKASCIIDIAFDMVLASYDICKKNKSSPDEYKLQLLQNKFKSRLDNDILNEKCMVKYCKTSLDVCRRMLSNNPVLEFSPPLRKGDQINHHHYTDYTKSGSCLNFMVFPALILHNEGIIVHKGVVQSIQENST